MGSERGGWTRKVSTVGNMALSTADDAAIEYVTSSDRIQGGADLQGTGLLVPLVLAANTGYAAASCIDNGQVPISTQPLASSLPSQNRSQVLVP